MDGFVILLGICFLAVVALFAYFSYQAEQQRREQLAELAAETGWTFAPDRDRNHDDEYANFEIFRRGSARYAYNTLFGTVNIHGHTSTAKMGDFHYQTTSSNGKQTTTHTHRFSYLIVDLPYGQIPDLLIRREGIFDSLKAAFGFDDIDFESAEFSKRFHVTSSDKRFAYDVIHPPVIEFLLASDPGTIDIEHGHCCLSDGRRRWAPDEFRTTLDWTVRFFDLWPKHLTALLEPARREERA